MGTPKSFTAPSALSPYAAIAVVSLVYYGLYADAGFNIADDGNYAQIAYELYLGRTPAELATNYGLAWFQIGATLFDWFGVDYDLVRVVFFGAITLTNLLVYAAVDRLTGRPSLALAAVSVTLLVPSFPATAFYGLCIMMNVAAQARLAVRTHSDSLIDAGLAGLALSISFQLRPDFGYAFAISLALVLALSRDRRGAIAAASTFVACLLPGLMAAALRGYGRELIDLYLSYPALMIEYLTAGLSGPSASSIDARSLLQRPSLSALIAPSSVTAFAWLVYLPIMGMVGYVVISIRDAGRGVMAPAIVTLSAAAAFPHYFLFRPDMAHLANFMPGYTVIAAAVVARLTAQQTPARRIAAALVGLHLAIYGWIGVSSPGTGSIAINAEHDQVFRAGNGIEARVTAADATYLSTLHNLIAEHSPPGAQIVCLPYCPGVAFMTERRMLLPEFYVDDSFPTRKPGWLVQAIETTRAARPPVVIVTDWAINGTEISRFKNWAAPYMSMLEEISTRKIELPGTTVYLIAAGT